MGKVSYMYQKSTELQTETTQMLRHICPPTAPDHKYLANSSNHFYPATRANTSARNFKP